MEHNTTQFSHIYLASDHAGLECKDMVRDWLQEKEFSVTDFGAFVKNDLDDFPVFISQVARTISQYPKGSAGIIFGGSGQGEAIMANRFPNVRAAVYYGGNKDIVKLSREHNDANVLAIGARMVDKNSLPDLLWQWLNTPRLEDKKYIRRNEQITQITKQIPRQW